MVEIKPIKAILNPIKERIINFFLPMKSDRTPPINPQEVPAKGPTPMINPIVAKSKFAD